MDASLSHKRERTKHGRLKSDTASVHHASSTFVVALVFLPVVVVQTTGEKLRSRGR